MSPEPTPNNRAGSTNAAVAVNEHRPLRRQREVDRIQDALHPVFGGDREITDRKAQACYPLTPALRDFPGVPGVGREPLALVIALVLLDQADEGADAGLQQPVDALSFERARLRLAWAGKSSERAGSLPLPAGAQPSPTVQRWQT